MTIKIAVTEHFFSDRGDHMWKPPILYNQGRVGENDARMNAKLKLDPLGRPIWACLRLSLTLKGDCTKTDNQIRFIDIVIVLKTLKSNAAFNTV